MAELVETYACAPSTERGRGILISGDPKSNSILYCNGRSVLIRYLDRPLEVKVYGEHGYPATVARYSPNGEWIASADVSGVVRIWGTHNDFVLKKEYRVLSGRIDDLQWSADATRIVASGDGKGTSFIRAFVWDSGSNVGEFDGHSKRVLSCAFKPTRPFRIASCGEDFLVNFYEGPPFKFKLSHRDHSNFVNCIRFSPDGNRLISVSSDKKGILYDAKTGEKIGQLSSEDGHKGSIYAVCWSPDSKMVITVSADKTAKLWEIPDDNIGKVIKTLACPGSGGVDDMLVGCLWQNDHVITVSLGGTMYLYAASDLDKAPLELAGHVKSINSLAVLKGEPKVILTTSYDGLILKWIQGIGCSGKLERNVTSQIKCFAAVEGEVASSGYDNKVWRFSVKGDQCGEVESVDIGNQPKDLGLALASPDLLLVSIETGVVLLRGTTVLSTIDLGFTVTACVISPNGTEAVVGGQDGKLRIYSIAGDSLKGEAVLEKHRGAITVIRYSPDVSMFASADVNREATVWDCASREVKVKNMLYHTARINCVAWSPDSKMVATGSLDTCVIVYDVDKPASSRITMKGAHLGGVNGLGFIDERMVVSCGEDGCMRVWKVVDAASPMASSWEPPPPPTKSKAWLTEMAAAPAFGTLSSNFLVVSQTTLRGRCRSTNITNIKFSISWPRIFPNGTGQVNWKGVAYYNRLINYMLKKGIAPYPNLNHYDLPQALEDRYNGWLSHKVVKDFADYAEFCFKTFGDRVKNWQTFNEPRVVAALGYDTGFFAPGRCSKPFGNCTEGNSATEPYIVAHNLILSHAAAVKRYRDKYQEKQKGRIGILLDFSWYEPLTRSKADNYAAQRARDFHFGWFMHPLTYGEYPKTMQNIVGKRLPKFTEEEVKMVKGSFDFVGVNQYTAYYMYDAKQPNPQNLSYQQDWNCGFAYARHGVPIGPRAHSYWLYIVPWGLYKAVNYIKERYGNPTMILAENGMDQPGNLTLPEVLHDTTRIKYYKSYIAELKKAIDEGANVIGYFQWTFVDNFEWRLGYTSRFGIVYVDFNTLRRYPKKSAYWFQQFQRRDKH